MTDINHWLRLVADMHSAQIDALSDKDTTVERIRGGANNALYRVTVSEERYALKLCIHDDRRRAKREYTALYLLHDAGLDLAPEPFYLDESARVASFPVVVYRWLPGAPLDSTLNAPQLAALLDSFHAMRTLHPSGHNSMTDAIFHWFDFAPYLADIHDMAARYGPWLCENDPDGRDLHRRLARLIDACTDYIQRTDTNPARDTVSICLCRVDPNRANAIWGGDGRVRWVDWEYSGWGDPALELADLRWHAAWEALSEAQHTWIREHYRRPPGDAGFEARLAAWDRLVSTRWPLLVMRLLWSLHNGPDRVRLTRPTGDETEIRDRLIRFIERAERAAGLA